MKWGIRRYQPYGKGDKNKGKFVGKREEKKKAKQLKKDQKEWDENVRLNWHKAYNNAADYANNVLIPEHNKKWGKYDWTKLDLSDPSAPKGDAKLVANYLKYETEYHEKWDKLLSSEYDKLFGKRPE